MFRPFKIQYVFNHFPQPTDRLQAVMAALHAFAVGLMSYFVGRHLFELLAVEYITISFQRLED